MPLDRPRKTANTLSVIAAALFALLSPVDSTFAKGAIQQGTAQDLEPDRAPGQLDMRPRQLEYADQGRNFFQWLQQDQNKIIMSLQLQRLSPVSQGIIIEHVHKYVGNAIQRNQSGVEELAKKDTFVGVVNQQLIVKGFSDTETQAAIQILEHISKKAEQWLRQK